MAQNGHQGQAKQRPHDGRPQHRLHRIHAFDAARRDIGVFQRIEQRTNHRDRQKGQHRPVWQAGLRQGNQQNAGKPQQNAQHPAW